MAFFRYRFTDARGQVLEGTLQADTVAEAEATLKVRGYPNAALIDPNVQAPPVVAASAQLPARKGVIRTRKGSDKDRFYLFSQFAKLLNAGVNPAKAFEEVARVTRIHHFRDSFLDLSRAATQGETLSATMARYPDLYPDHVVGMMRAGEAGGFMPEAFALLSQQAEDAYKFKRFHWFIWYLAPRALLAIPIALAVVDALVLAYKRNSETQPVSFVSVLIELMIWPYGPMMLAIGAVMLVLRWWFSTHRMRHFRHRMGLKAPIYGPRARNESVAVFTWTLSRLSKAGLSPQRSWELATAAVPNLEMQERLRDAGARMHSGSRLSEVVFGSRIFPDEYAPILSTGELTGDIVGSLETLERASRNDFEESSKRAKWGSMRIGAVFAIVTSGIVVITLIYGWYHKFYGAVLDDYKWSQE